MIDYSIIAYQLIVFYAIGVPIFFLIRKITISIATKRGQKRLEIEQQYQQPQPQPQYIRLPMKHTATTSQNTQNTRLESILLDITRIVSNDNQSTQERITELKKIIKKI